MATFFENLLWFRQKEVLFFNYYTETPPTVYAIDNLVGWRFFLIFLYLSCCYKWGGAQFQTQLGLSGLGIPIFIKETWISWVLTSLKLTLSFWSRELTFLSPVDCFSFLLVCFSLFFSSSSACPIFFPSFLSRHLGKGSSWCSSGHSGQVCWFPHYPWVPAGLSAGLLVCAGPGGVDVHLDPSHSFGGFDDMCCWNSGVLASLQLAAFLHPEVMWRPPASHLIVFMSHSFIVNLPLGIFRALFFLFPVPSYLTYQVWTLKGEYSVSTLIRYVCYNTILALTTQS